MIPLLLLLPFLHPVAGSGSPSHSVALPVPSQDDGEISRLEEWPEEPKEAGGEIKRLRKAGTPEMAADARELLIDMGAGAVPSLIVAYSKERSEDGQERVADVLREILGPRHTRLIAREFGHKEARVRVLMFSVASSYPDAGIREDAEGALAKATQAREAAEKKGRDLPADERGEELQAALACTSAGSLEGLPAVIAAAGDDWAEHGAAIRRASAGARGEEAGEALVPLLKDPDKSLRLTGLRLAAGLGTTSHTRHVAPFLDNQDNRLKVAAINALRGMVDGDPPLDKIPVFQAIDLAEDWKKRL